MNLFFITIVNFYKHPEFKFINSGCCYLFNVMIEYLNLNHNNLYNV